ncbi:NAD-dependent succinate-semialdehyde dehydrogenase [Paraburkholderia tropica]|uniref:NAD-dependent succinate-semialdehyde dehydrogenase n=1 Tax=Paraburkholderia tropica TaxID=92647 RepID=UPI0008023820|nr:NAD-dependent succinate-semialdehyde dehydrogenase [Paraburkholderia tropica]OBR46272.1 NAD-dependent succinate-semialdehyde dehydrogenase [Paraburkholderia tropica]
MTKYINTNLFIDGQWCEAESRRTIDVFNPASGEKIGFVSYAGIEDLERCVKASVDGFARWRKVPAVERAATMRKAAALMRERVQEIACFLTMEQGKPILEARTEVLGAADIIEWFADEGRRVYGRIVPPRNIDVQQMVIQEPVGPVAAFTPWNFPITQVVRKLCGALATGCSFIVKAPEETPASPAALIRAFADAGVPRGVLGLVYGNPTEISKFLISHPAIRKVTFTGSTSVGKHLASLAGLHMKRATMELGGHAPVIIAEDADLELAVKSLSAAKFRNAGQVCISPTRFLVHNSLRDDFADALVKYVEALRMGDGLIETTTLGPLANARRVMAIKSLVSNARQAGAKVATGGEVSGDRGNFFAPTVLLDVPLDAEIFNQEPFGPIVAMRGFDSLDEAVEEANRLPYGLASYAFTKSVRNVHMLSQSLEVGMLWVNQPAAAWPEMPFGGVKDSGYGSEGGPEALQAYLTQKSVSVMCS